LERRNEFWKGNRRWLLRPVVVRLVVPVVVRWLVLPVVVWWKVWDVVIPVVIWGKVPEWRVVATAVRICWEIAVISQSVPVLTYWALVLESQAMVTFVETFAVRFMW